MNKWQVFRIIRGVWVAAQRGRGMDRPAAYFRTHADAIAYANTQSLADQMLDWDEAPC